jgi:myo-inositol-1(or 4)-monophosphatase
MARFEAGVPVLAILDVPPLRQRIVAIRGEGAWRNGKPIPPPAQQLHNAGCASLCSRSIRVLQKLPHRPFPGKIRLLGVASLNLVSVAMGQTMAALEATPKIWDLAAAWLVLEELGCPLRWLGASPRGLLPARTWPSRTSRCSWPTARRRWSGSCPGRKPLRPRVPSKHVI